MEGPSSISIPLTQQTAEHPPFQQQPPPQTETAPSNPAFVPDKTLSSAANLVKLLPSGTVLTFQSLSPSFSNHGNCTSPDKFLIGFLIVISTLTCFVFSFTDSFVASDGKHYYGIATFRGLHIINKNGNIDDGGDTNVRIADETRRYRIKVVDVIHSLFSSLLFVTIALSDSDVQTCLFPGSYIDTVKELFTNLPIGMWLLSGLVFMIFPTTRKAIGYSEMAHDH